MGTPAVPGRGRQTGVKGQTGQVGGGPPLSAGWPGRHREKLLLSPPGQVFSQHPYAENFIGKPHVWTVDYNNSEEFEAAIKAIMRTQVRLRCTQDCR